MSKTTDIRFRPMRPEDRIAVAILIAESTNSWYVGHGKLAIFPEGTSATSLFCDVYEALDPGCCIVAEDSATGELVGSCFYHPRDTHVSLGIMNVRPSHFSRGVAGRLLAFITDIADGLGKPIRLVSSAMNLDSFSLYTRAGFVPRAALQDMTLTSPPGGKPFAVPGLDRVRPAMLADIRAIVDLEWRVGRIRRPQDYQHFIAYAGDLWHTLVLDDGRGGVLASVEHPGSNMLGPGVMRTAADAAALIAAHLNRRPGRSPLFLVPVDQPELVRQLYAWGARNCEIHFCQVRGAFEPFQGVVMPTFMPETG